MSSSNGFAATAQASERLATLLPLAPEEAEQDPYVAPKVTCSTDFFRQRGACLLDLVALGKTIEVALDLAPSAPPVAVVVPWAWYAETIAMREKIAAITGGFQPPGGGLTAQSGRSQR